jgi:membrane protease YdiL (CAAX protease family)
VLYLSQNEQPSIGRQTQANRMRESEVAHTASPIQTLIVVSIVLGVTCTALLVASPRITAVNPYLARDLPWWVLTALIVLYVAFIERQSLRTIGFKRPTAKTGISLLVAYVLTTALFAALAFLVFPALHLQLPAHLDDILASPWWARALLVIRAGVTEEVIFRGFAMERLRSVTGGATVAFLISTLAFTFAHYPTWGWSTELIFAALGGAVFAAVYLWRRDLPLNILLHSSLDATSYLTR